MSNLLSKTAAKIGALTGAEQAAINDFIDQFRLSLGYAQEFVDYLIDISRRDDQPLDRLLNKPELLALKAKSDLPPARKMELLRALLRRWRFSRPVGAESFLPPKTFPPEKGLVGTVQKGRWLKRCPGTHKHICCNYLVINSIAGCPFDCTYCFLHGYLNRPEIAIYLNHDALIEELKGFFDDNRHNHYRVGTGEFSDSLALDKVSGLSPKLVKLFAGQDDHLLELKTKSVAIDGLLGLEHNRRTVIAWSVNPERIVASEELKTPSLTDRLKAAARAVAAGYPVAFHFDPIIHCQGWAEDYREVVDRIFEAVDEKNIAWISLGALRYPPKMKSIIERKFPHSKITLGELDIGEDNKLRYLEPVREELFQMMADFIRANSREVYVYLCMESPEMWRTIGRINEANNRYAVYFKYFAK